MDATMMLVLVAFLAATSLVFLLGLLLSDRNRRVRVRLQEISGRTPSGLDQSTSEAFSTAVRTTLPKVGRHLMPDNLEEQTQLKTRLIQAGFYQPQALPVFLGVKMVLIVAPLLVGLAGGMLGIVPTNYGVLFGGCASLFGMIGPSFWLDSRRKQRQTALRRGLPDALDLIVICMEGGMSLGAAQRRIAGEIEGAHPALALELAIVQREVQLGQPIGEALRDFGLRTDLSEVRNMAAAVKNAEKFGASMSKTLRTFGDTLRVQRRQYAEEMAQKAGTKILFPTLLFIFPAIFLIILGPAAIQIIQVMGNR